jgi:hypothetical protein
MMQITAVPGDDLISQYISQTSVRTVDYFKKTFVPVHMNFSLLPFQE